MCSAYLRDKLGLRKRPLHRSMDGTVSSPILIGDWIKIDTVRDPGCGPVPARKRDIMR